MALWEVSLRASYDYPFIELSREVPDTPIAMWCLWNRELLQVPNRDAAVLKLVERRLRSAGRVVDEWVDAGSSRIFLLECTCGRYDSPWNVIEEHQCWDAPPLVYLDGWANLRVLTFDPTRPQALYQDLQRRGPAELVRKRELPLAVLPTSIYTHAVFGGLTERQREALLAAFRLGYYRSPRPITTARLARSLGRSRSTYEEHLRKAENQVMGTLLPYLELFAEGVQVPERLPTTGSPVPAPPLSGRTSTVSRRGRGRGS